MGDHIKCSQIELKKQFNNDGGNFEDSTSYHRLSSEIVIWTTAILLREKKENDQSFNFALNPETLATRGRFPLQLPGSHISASIYTLQKSIHMLNPGTASYHIGDDGVYTIEGDDSPGASRGMIDSHECTISLWVSCSAFTINQRDTGWGSSKKQVMFTWGG